MPTFRFRMAMFRKGLTCTELAKLWGLHPVTIRNYHCGHVAVPRAQLKQLEEMGK